MTMTPSPQVQKALDKLQASIEQGQTYDGQQKFKTIYSRLKAQKKLNDSYKMLEEGACLQLQQGQFTCGVELAQMLVEAYTQDSASCSRDNLHRIYHVMDTFPREQSTAGDQHDAVEQCTRITLAAIKWGQRQNNAAATLQHLHGKLAAYIWECQGWQGLGQASQHYVRCKDMTSFAAALEQSAAQGSPEEEDLFIARGVLQLLATGKGNMLDDKLADAQDVLQSYDVMHTQGGLPKTPLMNFIHLLIKALEKRSSELVSMLQQTYHASLAREPAFSALLQRIKSSYLGASTAPGMQGLLSGMMQMLSSS